MTQISQLTGASSRSTFVTPLPWWFYPLSLRTTLLCGELRLPISAIYFLALPPFHSANQRPPSKCLSPSRSNHRMPCPMTWHFAQSPVAQAILASFHIRLLSSKDGYQSADSTILGTGTLFLIKFFLIILPCPQNKI